MTKQLFKKILKEKGATIKNEKIINYKTGYQVAVNSKEVKFQNLLQAVLYIKKNQLKKYGLWFNGLWYLDTNSVRISTKKEAQKIAKENNQLAIYDWKKGVCI